MRSIWAKSALDKGLLCVTADGSGAVPLAALDPDAACRSRVRGRRASCVRPRPLLLDKQHVTHWFRLTLILTHVTHWFRLTLIPSPIGQATCHSLGQVNADSDSCLDKQHVTHWFRLTLILTPIGQATCHSLVQVNADSDSCLGSTVLIQNMNA